MKKFISILVLVFSFSMLLAGCESSEKKEAKVLYVSGIPDQKQSDLKNAMEEVASIISKEVGIDAKFKEVTDYASVVNGFERDEIQLAWFGGLTGVQGREKVKDSNAVVQRIEDEKFKSVFIAGANSNINKLADYSGKSFTFGSESSTSGHLMPRYFITKAGINPEKDFKGEVGYSGSHDKTIELVANGAYEGGALNVAVWDRYVKEGKVDLKKVKVVETSPEYYDYNFSMPPKEKIDKDYGEGTYDKIVQALLKIDIPNNERLNNFFNSKGFIETKNDNYKEIHEVAKNLGLL